MQVNGECSPIGKILAGATNKEATTNGAQNNTFSGLSLWTKEGQEALLGNIQPQGAASNW